MILQNWRFLLITVFFFTISLSFAEGTIQHIQGDKENHELLNMVILAEGYTESEEQQFSNHVAAIISKVFTTTPYKQYIDFINVWTIFVVSQESGADHPLDAISKDTYFGATFGTSTQRLVTITNRTAVYDLLAEHVPDYDFICVLVNDDEYGGSGGSIAVVTVNVSSPSVFLHETGHSFALLADEYETAYSLQPSEKYNVTAKTERHQIPWGIWILAETPVPTPETSEYNSVIGLFEGAMYQPDGWYRPKLNCTMRSLGYPFCEVCTEAHILQFYTHISPIKQKHPDVAVITNPADTTILSVETYSTQPNTIKTSWFLDGEEAYSGSELRLDELPSEHPGEYTLTAVVRDTTPLVHNPAVLNMMIDSATWHITTTITAANHNRSLLTEGLLSATVKNGTLTIQGLPNTTRSLLLSVFTPQGRCIVARKDISPLFTTATVSLPKGALSNGMYIITVSNKTFAYQQTIKVLRTE